MRDIKFRGMGADGIMYYGCLSQDQKNSTTYYNEYSQRISWMVGTAQHNIPVSNKTLGQYTGLKDKIGAEIYNGDILKCTDGADEIDIRDSDTGIGCVEWNEEYAFWSISKIENGLGDILHKGYIEIIGNKYEDPERIDLVNAILKTKGE